jgi:nicotinamidase-related amidase
MQNGLLMPGAKMEAPGGRELIPKLKKLMDVCRSKGILVIFTRHIIRKDGSDLGIAYDFFHELFLLEGTEEAEFYKGIEPEEGDIIIKKSRYNAFHGTDFDLFLRCKGIDTLIIGGVATNRCCGCTVIGARTRDYKVIFLSDGNAALPTPDMGWGAITAEEAQRFVLATFAHRFAQVSSVEEVIAQVSQPILQSDDKSSV